MITFLLTILGTFLTRSGVVNSVHSFTQSPIGPVFLGFLGICAAAVVVLLALRIDTLVSEPSNERLVSREGAFLLNNLLFVSLMFTVLVGTLYPIVAESLRGVKVSVGEPYFNRMAVPLFAGLLLMMGVGPALPWGGSDPKLVRRALVRPLPAAAVGLAVALLLGARSAPVLIVSAFAGFALWVTADQGLRPVRARPRRQGGRGPLAAVLVAPDRLGAYVVHLGVLITFVAVAVSSTFQREAESTLRAGDTLRLGGLRDDLPRRRAGPGAAPDPPPGRGRSLDQRQEPRRALPVAQHLPEPAGTDRHARGPHQRGPRPLPDPDERRRRRIDRACGRSRRRWSRGSGSASLSWSWAPPCA